MYKNKTIYLIDGSAYIYRAYHAIRELSNSKGLPTNAAFGFTKILLKLIEDRNPEYVGMFFDVKGPTFRHEMFDAYKANRPPMPEDLSIQIPYIRDITKGFNIPVVEMSGYEADDLIGTLARKAEDAGFSVIMVTGDKDFMQLVTKNSIIWDPMKEKTIDSDFIKDTYGLEPGQMVDVMGLSGDSADNIPGVPGIGPKTAVSLIKAFGSIELLYEQVDAIKKKKQYENLVRYKEQALLSRELVRINDNVSLSFTPEDFKYKAPDSAVLSELFKKLEFRQLQQSVLKQTDLSGKKYRPVFNIEELSDLVTILEASGLFALDTETTSKDPMAAELVGLSFSVKADEAFYIPCAHEYEDAPKQLKLDEVLKRLKPVLENHKIKKIGQNIKYDWIVLLRHGIRLSGVIFDTMLASYLINPSKRAHNLDQIALDFLDHKTISYEEVAGKGKNASCFSKVSLEKAVPYACEDADITLMAYNVLMPMLKDMGLEELFEKVEMPLVPVLMKMEMTGINVDREKLMILSKSFEHQLEQLEAGIYSIAGEEFNIRSSQQLGRILFEKLKLPVQKKTKKKTGYSTDVDVLEVLAEQHELPALILRHRTVAKLKSTYADALTDLINPETGRIHTSYNQTVTATGRLSSSEPNLQNIPVRSDEGREIRRAFIPRKGWSLLAADYSQIELRILAHYSDDKILIKAFKENEDIHIRTATEVFQVFPSLITSELRQQAKVINFGIVYGMSPYGLSKELGISQKMAKTYIHNYFTRYRGVKEFIDKTIKEARISKKTSTLLGRIRLLPDINNSNKNLREFAERTAINTPIQGTAADLIKIAMITVDSAFTEKGLKSAMLLSVHDEIVFEVPHDELDTVRSLVKDIMESVWDLKVPLKVNLAVGENWAEAK
ncbi:MAG: DNA polymerase I [Proteobacteria bacterium]|nr:DNA polymerase I [Pseudomonadota bacterium]MBU4012417.1 DNA polymerase I [Pseudomonadota bacterium]MBU4067953.1 DNA polymerase I [Pseudomonadota bacterium]MBU4126283.1 DNA polymerase I [Pseudomonadota bacterium]